MASRIVEALDEGEHCASRLGLRLEPAAIEQFAFEGREEALAHGVVIDIADRTHRGSHTCLTTAVAELDRGVLPGLKWSSQHFEGEVAMTGRRRRSELTVLGCHHGFGWRLSGSKIQIAFLGETKRTIPRSRPASGRASRAGLVQDAACGTSAQRRLVLDETEHGALLVQVGPPASSKTAMPNHVLR